MSSKVIKHMCDDYFVYDLTLVHVIHILQIHLIYVVDNKNIHYI